MNARRYFAEDIQRLVVECDLGAHPGTSMKFNSGEPRLAITDELAYMRWINSPWGQWLKGLKHE